MAKSDNVTWPSESLIVILWLTVNCHPCLAHWFLIISLLGQIYWVTNIDWTNTNTLLTLEILQKWRFTLWLPHPHHCTETCKYFGKNCQTPPCDYPEHVPTGCTFYGPRSCSKYRKMPVSCCTRSVNACLGCAGVCTLSDTDGTLTDRPAWSVALPPLQSTPKKPQINQILFHVHKNAGKLKKKSAGKTETTNYNTSGCLLRRCACNFCL